MIAGNRLATKTKIGYSTFNCGESIAYNLFYTYFLLFMTNFAGVEPAVGGTIALIAVLWDGVTDALVGYFSDKSTNPKGRRRPFMAEIPYSVCNHAYAGILGFRFDQVELRLHFTWE